MSTEKLPGNWVAISHPLCGSTFFGNTETGATTWHRPVSELPDGWQSAISRSTGQRYYYNSSSGEQRWDFVGEYPPPIKVKGRFCMSSLDVDVNAKKERISLSSITAAASRKQSQKKLLSRITGRNTSTPKNKKSTRSFSSATPCVSRTARYSGYESPLPPGWRVCRSKSTGMVYFTMTDGFVEEQHSVCPTRWKHPISKLRKKCSAEKRKALYHTYLLAHGYKVKPGTLIMSWKKDVVATGTGKVKSFNETNANNLRSFKPRPRPSHKAGTFSTPLKIGGGRTGTIRRSRRTKKIYTADTKGTGIKKLSLVNKNPVETRHKNVPKIPNSKYHTKGTKSTITAQKNMPILKKSGRDAKPGDFYEECFFGDKLGLRLYQGTPGGLIVVTAGVSDSSDIYDKENNQLNRPKKHQPTVWKGDIVWLVAGRRMNGVPFDNVLNHIALHKSVSIAEGVPLRVVFYRPISK